MLKIENVDVHGFDVAIRGMRNAYESWDKSDSKFYDLDNLAVEDRYLIGTYYIGENDLKLMRNLAQAGDDHGKFLRMINVTCDITAPRFFWEQFSTYRIGVTQNSTSTMHTIHKKPFEVSDFSVDGGEEIDLHLEQSIIPFLNFCRDRYLETKAKGYWRDMILALPQSYNQKRTVQLNYQVLKNMYHARKSHKLDEWREFCKWIETLPYFREICLEELK